MTTDLADARYPLRKPAEIVASINSKVFANRLADPDEIAEAYLTVIDKPYINLTSTGRSVLSSS